MVKKQAIVKVMNQIPEQDWKHLRNLKERLLAKIVAGSS